MILYSSLQFFLLNSVQFSTNAFLCDVSKLTRSKRFFDQLHITTSISQISKSSSIPKKLVLQRKNSWENEGSKTNNEKKANGSRTFLKAVEERKGIRNLYYYIRVWVRKKMNRETAKKTKLKNNANNSPCPYVFLAVPFGENTNVSFFPLASNSHKY